LIFTHFFLIFFDEKKNKKNIWEKLDHQRLVKYLKNWQMANFLFANKA
jgi:hypothetical protein